MDNDKYELIFSLAAQGLYRDVQDALQKLTLAELNTLAAGLEKLLPLVETWRQIRKQADIG